MVNRWLDFVQGALLPPSCVLCGGRGQRPVLDLCLDCAEDMPRNNPACPRCAMPVDPGLSNSGATCAQCTVQERFFDSALAPYRYAYPLDHLIRAYKYGGVLSHARVLGLLLAGHARQRTRAFPAALVPVPLHPARYRERGFNQAHELARVAGRSLGIAVDRHACERLRPTDDQAGLSAAQRRTNVRGAFRVRVRIVPAHVAIVDDVLTTGSTVNEIAGVLRGAGVQIVEVWAVARAVQGHPASADGTRAAHAD